MLDNGIPTPVGVAFRRTSGASGKRSAPASSRRGHLPKRRRSGSAAYVHGLERTVSASPELEEGIEESQSSVAGSDDDSDDNMAHLPTGAFG